MLNDGVDWGGAVEEGTLKPLSEIGACELGVELAEEDPKNEEGIAITSGENK